MVDHTKLDAALALALDAERQAGATLAVFVELDNDAEVVEEDLAERGVTGGRPGDMVRSATLSVEQVDELSEVPWVRRIRLSQRLRLSEELPRPPTRPEGPRGGG